jgi:hypothetical protein
MSDSLIMIIGIMLAAILMFIFPMMTLAERNDDVTQLAVYTATADFVDSVSSKGVITNDEYSAFVQTLAATGNLYDIDIQIYNLDEYVGKKVSWTEGTVIGENAYTIDHTTQVMNDIDANGQRNLKEGDKVSVAVKNTNTTIAQMLRSFLYKLTGASPYEIYAEHTRVVTSTGRTL